MQSPDPNPLTQKVLQARVQPSYFIGASTDSGNSWKFIDGSGIAEDREKLKQVLPDFPNNLPLPAKERASWQNR